MGSHTDPAPALETHPRSNPLVNHLKLSKQPRTVMTHLKVRYANRIQRLEDETAAIEQEVNEVISESPAHESTHEVNIRRFVQRIKAQRSWPSLPS